MIYELRFTIKKVLLCERETPDRKSRNHIISVSPLLLKFKI